MQWSPVAALGLLIAAGPAAAFDLVTADELRAERMAPEPARMRSVPALGAPVIELLAPTVGRAITPPIDIRLRWSGSDGVAIDPSSVKVRYGRLGIDITSRVLAAAKVDAGGIEAPGARLPAGEHRLAVEVADMQRRLGRREFVVEVRE